MCFEVERLLLDLLKNRFPLGDPAVEYPSLPYFLCLYFSNEACIWTSVYACESGVFLFLCKGLNQLLHTNNFLQVQFSSSSYYMLFFLLLLSFLLVGTAFTVEHAFSHGQPGIAFLLEPEFGPFLQHSMQP